MLAAVGGIVPTAAPPHADAEAVVGLDGQAVWPLGGFARGGGTGGGVRGRLGYLHSLGWVDVSGELMGATATCLTSSTMG